MNKYLGIILGLILLLVPVYAGIVGFWGMGNAALTVLKGGVFWILVLAGIMLLVINFSSLKEN